MVFNITTHKRGVILSHHPEVQADGIKELLELYGIKTDWPTNHSLVNGEILTTNPPKKKSVTVIQITTERNHKCSTAKQKRKHAARPKS